MKKVVLFFSVLAALTFAFSACEKEEKPNGGDVNDTTTNPDSVNPLDAFCGTYNITIVTDSVQNGSTWFANTALPAVAQIPTRQGRLTVTKVLDKEEVEVLGRICIAGDSVDYYRTTGVLDSEGRLQLASGQDYSNSTRTQHYSFAPISVGDTMVFKVDASYVFNGTNYVERSTNTIVKR